MILDRAPEQLALMEQALRMTPAFAQWPRGLMGQLLAASRLCRYSRGERVPTEGATTEVLALVSGHLTAGRTPAGGVRAPFILVGPGMLAGITHALGADDDASYDFMAIDEAVVGHLPVPLLLQSLDHAPELWRDMALMLLRQQREALNTLMKQLTGMLPQRLAATIVRLAELYGSKEAEDLRIRISLKQEDLAALLRTSRQSVNRELQSLVVRGAIALRHQTITILDLPALKQVEWDS
jgi:CRP/FNR family transcriptional regulator, cyclic AMP receptor protein